MTKTISYSKITDFHESFKVSQDLNPVLYVQEDVRKGQGNTHQIKLYFTTPSLMHEYTSRVATGTEIVENESRSELWIQNDYYHGESRKTRAYNHYDYAKQTLLDFINHSGNVWEHLNKMLAEITPVIYIKELY